MVLLDSLNKDDQNQARREAETLLGEAQNNLALVRMKLEVGARNLEIVARTIRSALESPTLPGAMMLPDKLLGTSEVIVLFEEWRTETNPDSSARSTTPTVQAVALFYPAFFNRFLRACSRCHSTSRFRTAALETVNILRTALFIRSASVSPGTLAGGRGFIP